MFSMLFACFLKHSDRYSILSSGRFLSLHAHAAGSSEGRHNRSCDRCNHLYDELNGFSLCHGNLNFKVRSALPLLQRRYAD